MKKLFLVFLLLLPACSDGQASVLDVDNIDYVIDDRIAEEPLIIVGEGGTSGTLFTQAAQTFQADEGGVIYEVRSGDEFIAAVKDFYEQYGRVEHLEYFGHGNAVALFVDQTPGVNGALYANDPVQNVNYIAASIFELPAEIFVENSSTQFNGCGVAGGEDSFAQRFANYFGVDVVASLGPTEFDKNGGNVVMVATYEDQDFIDVDPQPIGSAGIIDVREGQSFEEAVTRVFGMGLELELEDGRFWPYNNITYGEALQFCALISENCYVENYSDGDKIRNLHALQMLVDADGVDIGSSYPWHQAYTRWASDLGVINDDFVNKTWFTRAEMAELTWNFVNR
jgi:hypothetical protein